MNSTTAPKRDWGTPIEVTCDSCAFTHRVDNELAAYADALTHEQNHPDHFVYLTAIQ